MSAPDMEESVYQAYKKDFQNGVITLGNICSADCVFCSQKWNPPGVLQDLNRLLTWRETKHFIDEYLVKVGLNPDVEPAMGSALHTNSGEFFLHPDAAKILQYLKSKNKVQDKQVIISNGMNITQEHVRLIKKLKLGIQMSLNCCDIEARRAIMKGSYLQNKNAVEAVDLFEQHGISYEIAIVPYKKYLHNGVLEDVFRCLKGHHVKSFVVHKPGHTRFTPDAIAEELKIDDQELLDFGAMVRQKYQQRVSIDGYLSVERKMSEFFRIRSALARMPFCWSQPKLFLCSQRAEQFIRFVLKKAEIKNYRFRAVEPRVFGGSADCAGLLTVEDYRLSVQEYLKENPKPDYMILSKKSFDINHEDLKMVSAYKLQEMFNIKVILV
ncbi:MAG: radical SAM protein [Candidatus Omnitrophica bacterium]|nr:radical SAM protein [Candidatus Omnitrophota bacterium]